MKNIQKQAFIDYEADAWFDRNKVWQTYEGKQDILVKLLHKYEINPQNILEIGCSAGYRLNYLADIYPECNCHGIDPSKRAIEFGTKHYPKVKFVNGTIDELPYENEWFDVVIVGFVFYVVDRNILFQSIAAIDRVLKNNGFVIIVDFFAERAYKNHYEHISNEQAYTFKQRYEDIFTASHLYHLIDKASYYHGHNNRDNSRGGSERGG